MIASRIYTFADKRPDFLAWQARGFEAFWCEPYEFVVIDNGSTPALSAQIQSECARLGLRCLALPEKHHENPNVACAYPIDWAMQAHIQAEREAAISCIIDSDMFLVRTFSALDFVGAHELAALPQRRGHVRYIWNGLVFINHRTVRHLEQLAFHCTGCRDTCPLFEPHGWWRGTIEGQAVDVGGAAYFYLRDHPDCQVKYLHSTHHITPQRNNLAALPPALLAEYDPDFAYELLEQTFLHYGSGSNWKQQPSDYHQRKTALLHTMLQAALDGALEWPVLPHGPYRDRSYDPRQYLASLRFIIRRTLATILPNRGGR